jgi:Ca2+-binding EF-hand superfamily protein
VVAAAGAATAATLVERLSKPEELGDFLRALSPAEVETFRALFRETDTDHSGKIDLTEMRAALRSLPSLETETAQNAASDIIKAR